MTNDDLRFELRISLSIENGNDAPLSSHVAWIDDAMASVLPSFPAVVAYFVQADEVAGHIEVGLRFEGMKREFVKDTAEQILDESLERASAAAGGNPKSVVEESTLVPA